MADDLTFPGINDTNLLAEMEQKGRLSSVEAGNTIMEPGKNIRSMPMIRQGLVKVLREDDAGHEIFLYFLYPGQTCAMSLYCCMSKKRSEIHAIAEEDTELISVPIEVMDEWMARYPKWREFVMQAYMDRFHELLNAIDNIAFHQLDERLITYLQEKAKANHNTITTTHQKIADDLNSSRVVISRLLKQLEKRAIIQIDKHQITLL